MKQNAETLNGGGVVVFDAQPKGSALLDQVDILIEREGGLIECYVPTDLIDHEEVPVKEEWAFDIARQMREISQKEGGTGQQSPIQLGLIDGEPNFKIIDGFHRDAALKHNGEQTIYATIKLTDWNTLYDSRIFTARDHAHVRFSRVVQWIREVWQHSGLADKLSVEQAVLLYRFDTKGEKLGLGQQEAQAAKNWVARKEELWGIKAMTVHSYLNIAATVDPALIHSAREKKNGHELKAPTQDILKRFSKHIPNRFNLQQAIMAFAIANNLKGPEVSAICLSVRELDEFVALQEINNIDPDEIEGVYSDRKTRIQRQAHDPRAKGSGVFKRMFENIALVQARVEQSIARNEEVDGEMARKIKEAIASTKDAQQYLGHLAIAMSAMIDDLPPDISINQSTNGQLPSHIQSRDTQNRKISLTEQTSKLELSGYDEELGEITQELFYELSGTSRFLLALTHHSVVEANYATATEFYQRVMDLARLLPSKRTSGFSQQFVRCLKDQITVLTPPVRDQPLIRPRTGSNVYSILTPAGKIWLLEDLDSARKNIASRLNRQKTKQDMDKK